MLVCILCITACGEISNVDTSSLLVVTVKDGNGVRLPDKTVYVFSDDFPVTYANTLFSDDDISFKEENAVFKEENAIASAITDDEGCTNVNFGSSPSPYYHNMFINYNDALNHKYYFIVFDDEHKPHGFEYFVGMKPDWSTYHKEIVLP